MSSSVRFLGETSGRSFGGRPIGKHLMFANKQTSKHSMFANEESSENLKQTGSRIVAKIPASLWRLAGKLYK